MAENIERRNVKNLELRARMPQIFRALAILALVATVLAIGVGFYNYRNNKEFRMKGLPTELSKDVVAQINGYERREADGETVKYFLKADKATTFTDNHQELENVFLQVFDEAGDKFDKITASKAIYVPKPDGSKNFNAYFAGAVNIETRDALKVKTEQLSYDKATETAQADEAIEFSRENVVGKSVGAIVKIKEQRLELLKNVEINAFESPELAKSNVRFATISAGNAVVDQSAEKIEFAENVKISVTPTGEVSQPTDIAANHATAFFTDKQIKKIDLVGNIEIYQKPTKSNAKWTRTNAARAVANVDRELKRFELFENVNIETAQNNEQPTRIKTNYALYEKDADRFELKNGVEIVTVSDAQPTTIKSNDAIYEQSNGKIFLAGAAEITQGNNFIKGDNLTAELFPDKKLKSGFAKGSAYLKQTTPERTTEVSANELNAVFGDNRQIQFANAVGNSSANLIPANANGEYSKVTLFAANAIKLNFQGEGLLSQMQTDGRTTIQMFAPPNNPNAANKKLTADKVVTVMNASGKDFQRAEAVGNAELFVEPIQSSPANYKTTINAARFDCDFFETGNNAKKCAASGKAKTVRVPTVAGENRGNQTITADRLNAAFSRQTQDVESFEAAGNAKFSELDRNGIADRFTFTANDETVRLRGGEPTVWDSQARAKAGEIDWDTRNEKSFLRGKVSTTYYSQKQTNGATPFGNSGAPVFLTADAAELNHTAETALYTGNARAWQENNFVRADRLFIKQKDGQLVGDGAVQSLLYNAKKKENGKESTVPAFASANKMIYSRSNNSLRYEGDVDIRQGSDRITAGIANVLMNDKNEVAQTVAETNVVVTQPSRKAVGDYAQYTAENESIILRGNPARIEDAESGSTQGAQVTVFLRENRVVGESKANQTNTGRIRSVYKIKKQQ